MSLFLVLASSSALLDLQLCMGFRPSAGALRIVRDAYAPVREDMPEVERVRVHAKVDAGDAFVVAHFECEDGFSTDAWARAPSLLMACRRTAHSGMVAVRHRRWRHVYMQRRPEECVSVE